MMSRFLALDYTPGVVKPGYKPRKKAIVPRRPAFLRLMSDRSMPGLDPKRFSSYRHSSLSERQKWTFAHLRRL